MNEPKFSQHPIYKNFSLFLLLFTIVTLIPHYEEVVDADLPVRTSLIIHGALFLGWYILFYVQSLLVSRGSIVVHQRLGMLSLVLGVALLVSGVELLLSVMRSNDLSRTSFVWGIVHTTLFFFASFVLALLNRKNSHAHKRLMALASLSMISASVTRVAYLPIVPIDGTAFTLLSTYAVLAVPIIIDRVRFGAIHPVLMWGIPFYIATQIVFVAVLPNTELGRQLAFPF